MQTLKEMRESRGVTQKAIASYLGVSWDHPRMRGEHR